MTFTPLIVIVIVLVILGLALYAIDQLTPIDPPIKGWIKLIAVVIAALYIASRFL